MTDVTFNSKLNRAEKRAWAALIVVWQNFLDNIKLNNYRKSLKNFFLLIRRNMSLKINFLDSHFENFGGLSDKHGEPFTRIYCTLQWKMVSSNAC